MLEFVRCFEGQTTIKPRLHMPHCFPTTIAFLVPTLLLQWPSTKKYFMVNKKCYSYSIDFLLLAYNIATSVGITSVTLNLLNAINSDYINLVLMWKPLIQEYFALYCIVLMLLILSLVSLYDQLPQEDVMMK